MIRNTLAKILFATAVSLVPALTGAADTLPIGSSTWQLYTASDNQPRRILDGERYTYFFVNQTIYSLGSNDYFYYHHTPAGGVMYFDKQDPESGMHDLRERATLCSGTMNYADYNPRTGQLVMCYNDGMIDVFNDNGTLTHIHDLAEYGPKKEHTVTSLAFDKENNDIWVSTQNGMMHIDGATLAVRNMARWGKTVNSICRVGDNVIASIDGVLHIAPLATNISDVNAFKPIESLEDVNVYYILPLSAKSFAYIAGAGYNQLRAATLADNAWTATTLVTDNFRNHTDANIQMANPLEWNVFCTRDGYVAYNSSNAYAITQEEDAAKSEKISPLFYGAGTGLGSYDGESFWFQRTRGQYEQKYVNTELSKPGDYKWINKGFTVRNENNPLNIRLCNFHFHPRYGLLVTNSGLTQLISNKHESLPTLISAYSDGKFTNMSPVYFPPAFSKETAYSTTYNAVANAYPVAGPWTPYVDPVFDDYLFVGSRWDGFAAINLNDHDSAPIHYSATIHKQSTFPNFKAIFPSTSWKNSLGNSTNPVHLGGFDNNGTLWAFYDSPHAAAGQGTAGGDARLLYWTVEDRRGALESNDVTKAASDPKAIYIPSINTNRAAQQNCLALKHENNANLIVITRSTTTSIMIYDHNGTLEDTSDDSYKHITGLQLPGGSNIDLHYIYNIYEDPATGKVVVCDFYGVHEFDPNDEVVNNVMPANFAGVINNDGSVTPLVTNCIPSCATFDEYNRLWVGTHTAGIIGLSADKKSIVAEYTTQNSPIASDFITGLGWDPVSKRLFVSALDGLASVIPDLENADRNMGDTRITAIPAAVTPDFNGVVTLSNVNALCSLEVKDSHGTTVATIESPVKNVSYWDLRDFKGKEVPAGRYTIHDISRIAPDFDIVVIR